MRKVEDAAMSDSPWKKHVGILAYDLKGYGKRPSHERREAQERLEGYAQACAPRGAEIVGWRPTGDGGFIFFDGPLGANFDAVGLFRDEMTQAGVDPLTEVRFALHDGHVSFNGQDYDGPGLILVSRLLDGMPRQPAGLTVMSGQLAAALRDDRREMDGHLIRLIDIPAKEGPLELWACVVNVAFIGEAEQNQFKGSFGPRPWGFQHHTWEFDKNEVTEFLVTQPKYIPAGFAARAALRTVAILPGSVEVNQNRIDAVFAPAFHAMAPPLAAGTWPARGGEVLAAPSRAAAVAANRAAIAAVASTAHARATAAAGRAAARAAASASASAAASATASATATAAATAAFDAASAHASASAFAASVTCADLRAILIADGEADRLRDVMTAPLWLGGEPDGFAVSLSRMRAALLEHDHSWSVWLDWYDERLRGAPVDMDRDLARANALSEEDYTKGAAHMNCVVQKALEQFERERSPTPGTVDISPEQQKIVHRDEVPVDVSSKPGMDVQGFFAALRQELDPKLRRFGEPTKSNIVEQLKESVADLGAMLAESEAPRVWFTELEAMREEIGKHVDLNDPNTIPFRVKGLQKLIRSQELELQEKFPEEARVQNARRLQNQTRLTDAQQAAFREVVESAIDALSTDLQDTFGELLGDETPVVAEKDREALRDQPLTVEQRDRLYRLKALMLRVKELVEQPREKLEQALGRAHNAAQAIERFERVAEKFREVWDRIASFLTSG